MPESKPNWVPPRKFAALAKNPLIQQWLVSYPALNTKNEHLKRFGRPLDAIEYTPERIVKELEEPRDGKKNGKALKAKVKAYCAGLVDRGLTATASLTLSSFRKQIRFYVDDQVGAVLTGHKIEGSEEAYFDRKDLVSSETNMQRSIGNARKP